MTEVQQDQWHYRDEQNGKRLGPVDRDEISKLIADDRIDRATLVWNPAMTEWAKAATTELSSLFGDSPPPLPATEISRWAIYALALFPVWGSIIQAFVCVAFSDRAGLSPRDMYDHQAWYLFFIIGYGILGDLDEHSLKKNGLKIRGAAFLAAILAPVYIFASCRAIDRHARRPPLLAYLPLVLWFLAFIGGIIGDPLIFDADAPLVFRPDEWL